MKFPGGCKTEGEFAKFLVGEIKECIRDLKSKEETAEHLWDKFQIKPEHTRKVWDEFEEARPELEKHRKNREQQVTAPPAPSRNGEIGSSSKAVEVDSAKAKKVERFPGGCKDMGEFVYYAIRRFEECLLMYKTKDEIPKHLSDEYQISPRFTRLIWNNFAKARPDYFSTYVRECEQNREQQVTAPPAQATTSRNVSDYPGGCKSEREFQYARSRIEECISVYMNKEEIVNHLWDEFQIRPEITRSMWDHFERDDPDFFSKYEAECEIEKENPGFFSNRRMLVPKTNAELGQRPRPEANEQEQQQAATSSSEEQARKKQRTQNLQASQPPESIELWKQILSTVTRIETNSEQMLKLMTDAKSGEKQPVEQQEQAIGDNEQAENLQNQNQQLPQETQKKDSPGNEDSNNK